MLARLLGLLRSRANHSGGSRSFVLSAMPRTTMATFALSLPPSFSKLYLCSPSATVTPVIFAEPEKKPAFVNRHQLRMASFSRSAKAFKLPRIRLESALPCSLHVEVDILRHFCTAAAFTPCIPRTSRCGSRRACPHARGRRPQPRARSRSPHAWSDRLVGHLRQHIDIALVPAQAARRAGRRLVAPLEPAA